MFELFNEPRLEWNKPDSHRLWAQDMQMLIDEVRALGATNVLLLDGLGLGQWTNDLFPLVHDRIPNRMAMAVHPYLDAMRNEARLDPQNFWRKHFSISAAQVPMIATEWNATPKGLRWASDSGALAGAGAALGFAACGRARLGHRQSQRKALQESH
jgi:endoglucanase